MKTKFSLWAFVRLLKRFARSESGMTLPLLALSMVTMAGMTGIAIDTARAQLVQSKLQFSLDAAGLAAGSTVSTSNLNAEVTQYLNANFNGYLGATLTASNAAASNNNTVLTLTATATLQPTFMTVVGIKTMSVNASTTINRAVTGLELVLVLDNTGSMTASAGGGVSKIQALQSAATTLVNSLFANGTANGKLWVGIVPFSQAVNIGTSHPSWLNTTYTASIPTMQVTTTTPTATITGPGWGPTTWGGCVDARYASNEDVTDDPPSNGSTNTLFNQYYWPSDNLNYPTEANTTNSAYNNWATLVWKRCKSGSCSFSNNTCSTSNGFTCTFDHYTYASPINTTNQGPNLLCPQEMTPMTNNSATLVTAINNMVAEGDTLINQGLQWGWFMLSPRWQGQWGGTMGANGLPLAYNTPGMSKAVVLLTDGENTLDNTAHGAYWFVSNNRAGSTNSTTAETNLNTRTLQICTAMKNAGIYIYTIALGTDPSAQALSMLQSCATAQNYYFDSPSTTQLNGIFNQISDSLSNLRVSQ